MPAQIIKPEEEFHRVVFEHSDRNSDEHTPHFHLHSVHAPNDLRRAHALGHPRVSCSHEEPSRVRCRAGEKAYSVRQRAEKKREGKAGGPRAGGAKTFINKAHEAKALGAGLRHDGALGAAVDERLDRHSVHLAVYVEHHHTRKCFWIILHCLHFSGIAVGVKPGQYTELKASSHECRRKTWGTGGRERRPAPDSGSHSPCAPSLLSPFGPRRRRGRH